MRIRQFYDHRNQRSPHARSPDQMISFHAIIGFITCSKSAHESPKRAVRLKGRVTAHAPSAAVRGTIRDRLSWVERVCSFLIRSLAPFGPFGNLEGAAFGPGGDKRHDLLGRFAWYLDQHFVSAVKLDHPAI
jgi:hypothetical protein